MKSNKIIFLWATPRSVSTAFERIFLEREDFKTFHEPFSKSYYFSKDKQSNRYANSNNVEIDTSYSHIIKEITEASKEKNVFVKDMAFHIKEMHNIIPTGAIHAIITRTPKKALLSQYKLLPDFTETEAGYTELQKLYNYLKENKIPIFIFDGDEFRNNPIKTYENFCKYIKIPYSQKDLEWKKREIAEWELWGQWHKDAINSTTIVKDKNTEYFLPKTDKYKKILNNAENIYQEIING